MVVGGGEEKKYNVSDEYLENWMKDIHNKLEYLIEKMENLDEMLNERIEDFPKDRSHGLGTV